MTSRLNRLPPFQNKTCWNTKLMSIFAWNYYELCQMNFKDWRSSWNLPDQSSPASPIFKMAKWFADSISLFYSWNIFKQHLNLLLWRLIWNLSINCNQKRVRMGISYGRYKRSWCLCTASTLSVSICYTHTLTRSFSIKSTENKKRKMFQVKSYHQ